MELLWALMEPSLRKLGPTRPGLYPILIGLDRTWPGFEPNLGIGNMKIIVFPLDFVGFMHIWEVSAFVQYWGQLLPNLSLPGAILVLLWTVLGPTSPVLALTCANQAPHGANLRRLEPQVRPSCGYLDRIEAILEPLWALMKPSWRQPSATWSRSIAIWRRSGTNLGSIWFELELLWAMLSPIWN